jgi:hypothetical protein
MPQKLTQEEENMTVQQYIEKQVNQQIELVQRYMSTEISNFKDESKKTRAQLLDYLSKESQL